MQKNLSLQWTNGVKDPDEKKNLEASIRGSSIALLRLKALAEGKLKGILNTESGLHQYENSAWSHFQAHQNGRKQELKDILELLAFL